MQNLLLHSRRSVIMYVKKHRPSTSYQANNHLCIQKPHLHDPKCRKCKNTSNAPAELLAEYIGQTKRALRDRFGEHRRRPYKTRPPMQYRSTLIKKDTNSRTSNLFHSNSLILKENPYVELANHFI